MSPSRQRHVGQRSTTKRPAALARKPVARTACKLDKRPVIKKPAGLEKNVYRKPATKSDAMWDLNVTLGLGGKQVHVKASSALHGMELKLKIQQLLPAGSYVQSLVIASTVLPDTRSLADEVACSSQRLDITAVLACPKMHMFEPPPLQDVASILGWDDALVLDGLCAEEPYYDVSTATPEARAIAQGLDSLLNMDDGEGSLPGIYEACMEKVVHLHRSLRNPLGVAGVAGGKMFILHAQSSIGMRTIIISNPGEDYRKACFHALGFGDKIDLWEQSGLWDKAGWQFGSHHFWEADEDWSVAETMEMYLERLDEKNTIQVSAGRVKNLMEGLSNHFLFFVGHIREEGPKLRLGTFPVIYGGVAMCGSIVGLLGNWKNHDRWYVPQLLWGGLKRAKGCR